MDFRDYDTRLAAYAVIVDDDDRVLLAFWSEGAQTGWTMPGGGVEYDETPGAAAVREVHEETGYDVELTGLLGVDTFVVDPEDRIHRNHRPLKSVRIVYSARIVGGTLTHEADGTTTEARWIPSSEISGLSRVSLVDAALSFWRATPRV